MKAERGSSSTPGGGFFRRPGRRRLLALPAFFFCLAAFSPELLAFTIIEKKAFTEGPFQFSLEIQVYGSGSVKKVPLTVNSLKVKIKNEKRSSRPLAVKGVRAYRDPRRFQDIETKGYAVTPGQWVTRYFRFPKEKRPILDKDGFVQVAFDGFAISFSPQERKFQGPLK